MTSAFTFDPATHIFRKPDGRRVFSATQILAGAGLCDYSFIGDELRDYSMARGTSVHWMTQLEDQGALNYRRVPKSLRGYRKAWNTFKEASRLNITGIEVQFVSRFGFAGIIDRTATFFSWGRNLVGTAIIDIKTGPIAHHVRYQLVLYTVAAAGDDPQLARYIRRIAVRLKPNGTYAVKEFPISEWVTDWSEAMEAVRSVNETRETTSGHARKL